MRCFTTKELQRALRNVSGQGRRICFCKMFTGNLEERPVLIRCFTGIATCLVWHLAPTNVVIRDIVVTSQMSHLKNVLHLIGCCLESAFPVMVYEYAPGTKFLDECLCRRIYGKALSWKCRVKIAKDIASVLLYLHTSFRTPIIFRDLTPSNVLIDPSGVAKLFDFTFSVFLPPGEVQVKDHGGSQGGHLDPQHKISGLVTEKTDVYSFGVLMLALFTGETDAMKHREGTRERIHIRDYVKDFLVTHQVKEIADPRMLEDEGNNKDEMEQQLLDFLDLALRCTEYEGMNRPDMIDVAKELRQMEKSVRNT
ncbi:non-functional pseudokinase ZED1-like [Coffea arabica]|uniref:Non-functional pseudokinase ZED1-like n=1 Tax=Coffea arabica TaxID=13443 RepID=A0ABM4VZG7_COFAR